MRTYFLPLILATLTLAKPQSLPDLSGLPSCAQSIVLSQLTSTSCGTDIPCVCRDTAFIGTLRSLIVAQCGEADAAAAETFHRDTCAQNGVTIDAAPTAAASNMPMASMDTGATVTSTTIIASATGGSGMGSESMQGMASMGSVTGNPSMTASTTKIPSTTLGGDMQGQGTCTVTTTTVCHTATVALSSAANATPSSYTGGAADVVGVNGVLAVVAAFAALI